jgi:dienelactone hydrolase
MARWQTLVGGASWVVTVPAILLATTHLEIGELGLGAFGRPASITLGHWLVIGAVLAGACAARVRSYRMLSLCGATLLSLGVHIYRHHAYSTREVAFPGDGITIAATVYEPRASGRHPAVVLVHGSAPLKRGFYSMWAERLARAGIVVVVADKRGVGDTGGTFERNNNTSKANLDLLASDVVAALDFAATQSSVDTTRLGLFGLSQAGWVAPMAAVRSQRARFMVLITAPAVSVREEGVWSDLRGDDTQSATYTAARAEAVVDTVRAGGVDARSRLGQLDIPGLWFFGGDDNSIPTRKSVAVLDSLRGLGKSFQSVVYPNAGHLLFTRRQVIVPKPVAESWDAMTGWILARR